MMLQIDRTKCSKCGTCLEECPSYVIHQIKGGDDTGKAFVKHEEQCCQCYHCVAICSAGAISLNDTGLDDLEKIKTSKPTAAQLKNLIYSRRSIRSFLDEPVGDDFLEELIDVATHAGTASNLQSEGFIILKNRELMLELEEKVIEVLWNAGLKHLGTDGLLTRVLKIKYGEKTLAGLRRYHRAIKNRTDDGNRKGMIFRDAPAVMIIYGPGNNNSGTANSALAVRNMELYALLKGYGTTYCGFMVSAFHKKPQLFRHKLGLDKSQVIYSVLLVGKPKRQYRYKLPRRMRPVRVI